MRFGWRQQARAVSLLGYAGFGGEVLYIYFETFGSLINTAAFFIAGGVLMLALAYGFTRLQRRRGVAEEAST